MNLYLVQHGEAKPETEDPERPLTARGRDDIVRLGTLLARVGVSVAEIRHSGKRRAEETAHLLAAAVRPASGVVAASGLSPKDSVEPIAREATAGNEDIMLVGHLPFLERLASLLIAGSVDSSMMSLDAGALMELTQTENGWTATCLMQPKLLPSS